MKTPNGETITAYDLHDVEACGDIKYDVLSIEALDKIHNCLDLLVEQNFIKEEKTLKETYEKTIGIYKLERTDKKMWEKIWNHEIFSLFQMEQASGIKGIEAIKPSSITELATLNSVIRLMAPEKGAEQPLDMWVRYRENILEWKKEMLEYGLSEEEAEWLMNYPDITDGIAEAQEVLMKLTMEERLGGNTLNFSDKCRKGLAKKDGPLFKQCEEEFFENAEKKGCSKKLVHYVWDILLRVQRNYSFNKSHTLAYSLVALQEMNLAYLFPILFWNCACLITDSGGADIEEEENEEEDIYNVVDYDEDSDFDFDDDDDDEEEEEVKESKTKQKKKTKTTNYGKVATALGKMKSVGIEISPTDINKSTITFSPDVANNKILHGLSGITRVGEDVIKAIIQNRPYESIQDFLNKVKIKKPQMVNLIKSGAFDFLNGGDRIKTMKEYIEIISEPKKRVTLQNMKMLIDFNLLPPTLDFEKRVFNFNKYIKKFKDKTVYILDDNAMRFYEENFDMDKLNFQDGIYSVSQVYWDGVYKKKMDPVRDYVKKNSVELLAAINQRLFDDLWDKYCTGNISKWEMDSVSHYMHEHELQNVKCDRYGFADFYDLPPSPIVDRVISIKGKPVTLFQIHRIIGTVLDRDKSKKTVTLLTTRGVVTVKIYGQVFSIYDKQISEKGADGKKHVIDKSLFSRGNKIIVSGVKVGENEFLAKKYSRTPWHLIEKITDIHEDGTITIQSERPGSEEI